jgi:hypothetical protein
MAHKVAVINGKEPSGGVGGVSDADLSSLAVNFFTAGVVKLAEDYLVEQQTTPDMSVKVNTGKAHVKKADDSNAYVTELDTAANVNISSNTSGNPRIDALVIKVDLGVTPNEYGDNVPSLVVVEGTPAASPEAPTDEEIQTEVGSGNPFLRLANITVANGATEITDANIADQRVGIQIRFLSGYLSKRVNTIASSATPTPNADTQDMFVITALAVAAAFGAPTGTPTSGQGLIIRVKDNGSARALSFNAAYRFSSDLDAPTTTVAGKTIYLGFIWNATDSKWDCVALLDNF